MNRILVDDVLVNTQPKMRQAILAIIREEVASTREISYRLELSELPDGRASVKLVGNSATGPRCGVPEKTLVNAAVQNTLEEFRAALRLALKEREKDWQLFSQA